MFNEFIINLKCEQINGEIIVIESRKRISEIKRIHTHIARPHAVIYCARWSDTSNVCVCMVSVCVHAHTAAIFCVWFFSAIFIMRHSTNILAHLASDMILALIKTDLLPVCAARFSVY